MCFIVCFFLFSHLSVISREMSKQMGNTECGHESLRENVFFRLLSSCILSFSFIFFFLVSLCYILSILFLSVTEVTVFPLLLLLLYPCEKGKVLYGHLFMDYYVMQYSLSNLEP